MIKIIINNDNLNCSEIESILKNLNIKYQVVLANELNYIEKSELINYVRKTDDTAFPYLMKNGKVVKISGKENQIEIIEK